MERDRRRSDLNAQFFFITVIISNIFYGVEIFSAPFFFEYHLVDESRQEIYPHDAAHPFRELMMHVWFPHAQEKQRYPLVLFSHGLGKTYNGMTYTYLCQAIAQRGYIVASVSHTYAGKTVQFPDGRVAQYNFLHSRRSFDAEVEWWVTDMMCALNECERLFTISDVAIIGHSLGGATALQLCRRDNRVKIAINLDGPLYGENAHIPIDKPILCIFGSSVVPRQITSLGKVPNYLAFFWRYYFNKMWLPSLNTFIAASPNIKVVTVDGIVHDTFTDYAFTPDPVIQQWLIDGAQAQDIIATCVCEFLDCHLTIS